MAETKPDQAKPPRDLRQELTNKLVQTLEQGQIPWNKPWAALRTGLPRNMETGREYRGGNRLMLMLEQADRGYADPRYGTVKQINALGGRVKKGEHGLPVELWKEQPFYQRKDISVTLNGMRVKVFGEKNGRAEVGMPTEKESTLHVKTADLRVQRHTDQGPQHLSWDKARELDTWTSRVHTVFNVAQCEGLKLEPLAPAPDFDPVARGESLKAAMARDGLSYGEHPEHAFYSPKRDQVVLPPRGAFNSELGNEQGAARYYGTLLHEIGHATGAAQRLNREGITGGHRFGSEGYAKEELRAEMFSLFAAAQTGIPYDPERHAAYVQDWAKVLKNDKNEIFRAAAEAGKAVDYVLDKEQALQITQERQASVEVTERAADFAPEQPEVQPAPSASDRMQEAIRREDALLSKQPHELTFAEFATVATAQKLGPNHGREWAVLNGSVQRGELMGYAEGPTERDALRMMHKNRVNNALYDNMPDAVHPPGMETQSMPPQQVLDEYPDLQEKFAPAIKEYRQMLDKEDRKASEYRAMTEPIAYEKAVQTFVNGGGNEKDARRILDDVLLSDFSDKNLPKALEFHGFAKPHEADKLATAILTEENRKVAAKEDRKASEHPVMKQAEQGADKAPEPPEADKPERPARPRLRQSNRKAAAMER